MHDPIKTISTFGLSTTSQASAVMTIKEQLPFTGWSVKDFQDAINAVVGETVQHTFINLQDYKYTFLYLIQNFIILEKRGEVAEPIDVFHHSVRKSQKFQDENKIALSLESDYEPEEGETKHRSGSKSEKAYQIYCEHADKENFRALILEAFQNELDMSKGGATTYFHNMKKKYNAEH